jgi:hypothetical protein
MSKLKLLKFNLDFSSFANVSEEKEEGEETYTFGSTEA